MMKDASVPEGDVYEDSDYLKDLKIRGASAMDEARDLLHEIRVEADSARRQNAALRSYRVRRRRSI